MFGPDADTEVMTQKASTAEAILNSILEQENEVLAYQRAASIWRSKQTTELVGFTNNGLFASHYIRTSISSHPKWKSSQQASEKIQNLRDKELISNLGFEITANPSNTYVLRAQGQENRVVAILLDQSEGFESKSPKYQASPVEWSLAIAAQQNAPWVIAIKDSQLRLYPAKDGVGVGQKSQAETYFEIDLLTIDEDKSGLLYLIFSAEALAEGGTADELLANSRKFASELGIRLRERVYESVVPGLATEIANQLRDKGHVLDSKGLQLAYELTLRVLFRLLFQAYAEDRGLLPSGRNELFDSNSMKHWAQHLLTRDADASFGDSASIWLDLIQIWDAIDQGNPDMQIPAYNGGLFGSKPDLHPEGAMIRTISIPDKVMGPALRALVIDSKTEDGVAGAVDFRSLSVREFGTIYEGLLESSLSVAENDLTVDQNGTWVPAAEGDQVLALKNEVYFHSSSGERRATGSYYTPSFIVDHLIERSLEPALKEHLVRVKERIDSGDQTAAYKLFFDFRVADLAMGSAHFLVAAIDKIETIMRSFLLQPGNEVEGVHSELIRLENAAKQGLGKDEAAYAEIERASLLRRQIARRCIYGLDINPLAVELSRLAIWIHTFVPGLPMSSLEHNLVCANSLTGIGSVEEGLDALIPDRAKNGGSLFDGVVAESLQEARSLLEEVSNADEADKRQALSAAELARNAREMASRSKLIFDLAVSNRSGIVSSGAAMAIQDLEELYNQQAVQNFVNTIRPAHLPYLFPEVFLRENPGFDVVLGNPPWEELVVDAPRFWASKTPGLLSVPIQKRRQLIDELTTSRPDLVAELEARTSWADLTRGVLQKRFNLGVGDTDLYKAFGWVALNVTRRKGGQIGYVLPKTAFSAAGMENWRRHLSSQGQIKQVTYLGNKNQWIFNIDPRYSVAIFVYSRGGAGLMELKGPITSLEDFKKSHETKGVLIDQETILSFTDSASIPQLPSQQAADLLKKLKSSPPLKNYLGGKVRALAEFHATNDKSFFDHPVLENSLPVLSGKSFNLWTPETGEYFAQADPSIALPELNQRLVRQLRLSSSAFYGMDFEGDLGGSHPIERPRIAFRNVTNATNSRTFIPALIPPRQVLTNIAPYFLFPIHKAKEEAYLLGVTSSLIFDWYARKFVELAVNFHLLNSFPIPGYSEDSRTNRIVEISGNLSAVDDRYSNWAKKVGVEVGAAKTQQSRESLIAELDGVVAAQYGLTPEELIFIYDSFHVGWADETRKTSALVALENWSNK
jgi:hypothetical protein